MGWIEIYDTKTGKRQLLGEPEYSSSRPPDEESLAFKQWKKLNKPKDQIDGNQESY